MTDLEIIFGHIKTLICRPIFDINYQRYVPITCFEIKRIENSKVCFTAPFLLPHYICSEQEESKSYELPS